MKRVFAFLLMCAFALEPLAFAGLGNDKALYVGGTENQLKDGTEGVPSAKNEKNFVFNYAGNTLSVPYDQIDDLEYGQKAGRRVGVAIMVSPLA